MGLREKTQTVGINQQEKKNLLSKYPCDPTLIVSSFVSTAAVPKPNSFTTNELFKS